MDQSYVERGRMEGVDVHSISGVMQFFRYLCKWAASPVTPANAKPTQAEKANKHKKCISKLLHLPQAADNHVMSKLTFAGDLMWLRDAWDCWLSSAFSQAVSNDCGSLVVNIEAPLVASDRFRQSMLEWLLPDKVRYTAPASLVHPLRQSVAPNERIAASVANNHAADRGPNSLFDTANELLALGIECTGAPAFGHQVATFDCAGGARVCVVGAGWGTNFPGEGENAGMACLHNLADLSRTSGHSAVAADDVDISVLEHGLHEARAYNCSLAVASVHWGHEFELYPTEVQRSLARRIVHLGFDVVVGHHSHVTQPAEVLLVNGYRGRTAAEYDALQALPEDAHLECGGSNPRKALVLYSLGNFASTMYGKQQRAAALVTLSVARDGWWSFDSFHFGFNRCSFWFGSSRVLGCDRELILAQVHSQEQKHMHSKYQAESEQRRLTAAERQAVELTCQQLLGQFSSD